MAGWMSGCKFPPMWRVHNVVEERDLGGGEGEKVVKL